jgi:hypothetical protein
MNRAQSQSPRSTGGRESLIYQAVPGSFSLAGGRRVADPDPRVRVSALAVFKIASGSARIVALTCRNSCWLVTGP